MESRDHWPVRAIMAISEAVSDDMDDRIADHERRLHDEARVAPPPRAPFKAFPHKKRKIPGKDLTRMIELLETGGETIYTLESTFGYPKSLIERELADHMANWREHIIARASV